MTDPDEDEEDDRYPEEIFQDREEERADRKYDDLRDREFMLDRIHELRNRYAELLSFAMED